MVVTTYTVIVGADKAGERLDRFLADALPAFSRSRLKALITEGAVTANGGAPVADADRRVRAGETFTLAVGAAAPAVPPPQAMDLTVVFEDRHLIVVDKPAGLVVHPAPGNPDRTLVNALLAHCGASLSGIGGVQRPGIVHRLDKDTSGLLIAAKTDQAHRHLVRQFAEHSVGRAYYAVVWGNPVPDAGRISNRIGRNRSNRKKMAVVSDGGRAAVTDYRVIRRLGSRASLIECKLSTGRTHQVRVHMASIGCPIIGDRLYGGRRQRSLTGTIRAAGALQGATEGERAEPIGRQALHAYFIGFMHPAEPTWYQFESSIPNDINKLISFLEDI
jgi:23S rRNA pseudouridine1911/1915/1917 synthase